MARTSQSVNWPALVGGGVLLVLAVAYLTLRSADMPTLQFLAFGPNPKPGERGVFAVGGGDSIVLNRAVEFDVASDERSSCPTAVRLERFSAIGANAQGLLLMVYGTRPDGACLMPLAPDASRAHVYSHTDSAPAPREEFVVSQVPLYRDLYLLRPVEPIGRGDWLLYLPRSAEGRGDGEGPALYMLRVD